MNYILLGFCDLSKYIVLIDLNHVEDNMGACVPVALLPKCQKIVTLQMDSKLKIEEFGQSMEIAMDGCKKLHQLMLDAVQDRTESLLSSRGVFYS